MQGTDQCAGPPELRARKGDAYTMAADGEEQAAAENSRPRNRSRSRSRGGHSLRKFGLLMGCVVVMTLASYRSERVLLTSRQRTLSQVGETAQATVKKAEPHEKGADKQNAIKLHVRRSKQTTTAEAAQSRRVSSVLADKQEAEATIPDAANVNESCSNSMGGKFFVVDDLGYVCNTTQIDPRTGCCTSGSKHVESPLPLSLRGTDIRANSLSDQFSCHSCNQSTFCCDVYEYCVACCMSPQYAIENHDRLPLLASEHPDMWRNWLGKHDLDHAQGGGGGEGGVFTVDLFDYCLARCRHNSKSTNHENSYKARNHHCFGALSKVDKDRSLALGSHGIVVESGSVDQSCHQVCKIKGYSGCSDEAMPQINSCDILQQAFSCSVSCSMSEGEDLPAFTELRTSFRPGTCVVHKNSSQVTCDGSNKKTTRLCACKEEDGFAKVDST